MRPSARAGPDHPSRRAVPLPDSEAATIESSTKHDENNREQAAPAHGFTRAEVKAEEVEQQHDSAESKEEYSEAQEQR
jgi:hypothetical protein